MPKLVYTLLLFLLCSINSFTFKDFRHRASFAIDFIPIIGNIKSAVELISDEDFIGGDKLSSAESGFSGLVVLPGGRYLKARKNIKKGAKAMKIIKKVAKAASRAIIKVNSIQNIAKTTLKIKSIADENKGQNKK